MLFRSGLDAQQVQQVQAMRAPMLVRVMDAADVRADMADRSNVTGGPEPAAKGAERAGAGRAGEASGAADGRAGGEAAQRQALGAQAEAAKTLWKARGVPPAATNVGLAQTPETPARSASTDADTVAQQRAGGPTLDLRGDALVPLGADAVQLRVKTTTWAKKRWSRESGGAPEVVRNTDPFFDREVTISWQGVKHALSKANQPELRLIPHVAQILQSARLDASEPDKLGRSHIRQAHFLSAQVRLDDEPLTVGVVVHERADGQMFYDQFIINGEGRKHAPPLGMSGNGMPGEFSGRSVLQPHGGGDQTVAQSADQGKAQPDLVQVRATNGRKYWVEREDLAGDAPALATYTADGRRQVVRVMRARLQGAVQPAGQKAGASGSKAQAAPAHKDKIGRAHV
mgnify:CR=1 FL=1